MQTVSTAALAKQPGGTDEDLVEVKQLKPYLGAEDKRKPDGKPYSVTRARAAELTSRGLAAYTNPTDHDRKVGDEADAAAAGIRKKYEVKR